MAQSTVCIFQFAWKKMCRYGVVKMKLENQAGPVNLNFSESYEVSQRDSK